MQFECASPESACPALVRWHGQVSLILTMMSPPAKQRAAHQPRPVQTAYPPMAAHRSRCSPGRAPEVERQSDGQTGALARHADGRAEAEVPWEAGQRSTAPRGGADQVRRGENTDAVTISAQCCCDVGTHRPLAVRAAYVHHTPFQQPLRVAKLTQHAANAVQTKVDHATPEAALHRCHCPRYCRPPPDGGSPPCCCRPPPLAT